MNKSKEEKYREIFYAEAFDSFEQLNELFTFLEQDPNDTSSIESIFRITHTMKGNAMALGMQEIANLSHSMEDVFSLIKSGDLKITKGIFNLVFEANDKLGELIRALKSGEKPDATQSVNDLKDLLANPEKFKDEEQIDTGNAKSNKQVKGVNFSDQIQVPVKKLDNLLDLVGELIIEKDIVQSQFEHNGSSRKFKRLNRITSDMQYAIMDVRLVQIEVLFGKFHRIVRDVAELEGKEVSLELSGTEIEIDRNILKAVSDSLVHIVRNSVSHGIESSDIRKQKQKELNGLIKLSARSEKDFVVIEVEDDGKGMDPDKIAAKAVEKGLVTNEYINAISDKEKIALIFLPGFSGAEKVTEVSGRGVGMDVVKRSTESIGGQVNIESVVDRGSKISLFLPSSMAVKGALLFMQHNQEFCIPLSNTEAVLTVERSEIHKVGRGLMINYLGDTVSLIYLNDVFNLNNMSEINEFGSLQRTYEQDDKKKINNIILLNQREKRLGIVVDQFLHQKEIVEKPLSKPIDKLELFSGATILGTGNVCLVINTSVLFESLFSERSSNKLAISG